MKNTVIRKRNVFCWVLLLLLLWKNIKFLCVPQQYSTYAQSIIFFCLLFSFLLLYTYLPRFMCFLLVYCEYVLEDLNCFYMVQQQLIFHAFFFIIMGRCVLKTSINFGNIHIQTHFYFLFPRALPCIIAIFSFLKFFFVITWGSYSVRV